MQLFGYDFLRLIMGKQSDSVLKYQSIWGRSSAGRALHSHCRGQEFDPPRLHQTSQIFAPRMSSALASSLVRKTRGKDLLRAGRSLKNKGDCTCGLVR